MKLKELANISLLSFMRLWISSELYEYKNMSIINFEIFENRRVVLSQNIAPLYLKLNTDTLVCIVFDKALLNEKYEAFRKSLQWLVIYM